MAPGQRCSQASQLLTWGNRLPHSWECAPGGAGAGCTVGRGSPAPLGAQVASTVPSSSLRVALGFPRMGPGPQDRVSAALGWGWGSVDRKRVLGSLS